MLLRYFQLFPYNLQHKCIIDRGRMLHMHDCVSVCVCVCVPSVECLCERRTDFSVKTGNATQKKFSFFGCIRRVTACTLNKYQPIQGIPIPRDLNIKLIVSRKRINCPVHMVVLLTFKRTLNAKKRTERYSPTVPVKRQTFFLFLIIFLSSGRTYLMLKNFAETAKSPVPLVTDTYGLRRKCGTLNYKSRRR